MVKPMRKKKTSGGWVEVYSMSCGTIDNLLDKEEIQWQGLLQIPNRFPSPIRAFSADFLHDVSSSESESQTRRDTRRTELQRSGERL